MVKLGGLDGREPRLGSCESSCVVVGDAAAGGAAGKVVDTVRAGESAEPGTVEVGVAGKPDGTRSGRRAKPPGVTEPWSEVDVVVGTRGSLPEASSSVLPILGRETNVGKCGPDVWAEKTPQTQRTPSREEADGRRNGCR